MSREFTSAAAFKQSLEHRLREGSTSGIDFDRRRQLAVYDRMLARLSAEFGDKVTLKGGLAVEFRTRNARSTKDIDLSVNGPAGQILRRLRSAAARDLLDFMVFIIRPDDRHPDIQNDGMLYDGKRFRAECTLAGKPYGRPFGIDVVFGDAILGEPTIHATMVDPSRCLRSCSEVSQPRARRNRGRNLEPD